MSSRLLSAVGSFLALLSAVKRTCLGGKKVFKTTVTTLEVILFPFSGSVLGVFMT